MFQVPRFLSIRLVSGGFFISFLLVVGFTTISPTLAASITTSTTLLSDVGVIMGSGETIQFTVWVYAGFDPVPTGPIRITHVNNTGEYVDTTILGGKAVVNWTVGDFSEGVHIFEAAFQGFMDFSPSSGNCLIQFDNQFTPGSSKTTTISLDTNSTVVYKNSSIQFTVDLEIIGELQPHFLKGYIYIKNTNLSGSPSIHTHGPLPLHISAHYSFSFDYQIPIFTAVGINSFVAEYTGSSASQTKPCTSSLHNVTIRSTGFSLIQNLNQRTLQREESVLELNTTVLGDYPIGLELKSYYLLNQEEVILHDQILDSRHVTSYFSPSSTVPIGILSVITELIDPSTEVHYTNSTENVTIIDRARIDHSENASEYRHNETIRFDVYVTEEDVWTHPVVSEVELIDVTEGNHSISNQMTNEDGFVVIEYSIPKNSTVGSHNFCLKSHATGQFIVDTSQTFPVIIKGLTEFDLSYESGGVDRNFVTNIEVTVLSGGNPISEGFVALEFAFNSSVIETHLCEPGLEFQYFIKKSHPLGEMDYQVHFFDSPNYDEHIEGFTLTIFSNPLFNTSTMGTNVSTVIKGHTIRIWGQLEDETGKPLTYEEVDLTDITVGTLLGSSITDAQGIFFYDYYISESTQIGLHFVEITYAGNLLEFYHSSINSPVLSFTVRPPLSIMIDTEVVAEHWTVLTLEGGLNDEISLEWQREDESDWEEIGTVILNSSGQGFFNWSTPYYKGDFTIRAIGPNSTKYDFSSMYISPSIFFVEGSGVGNVNDPYAFTVNVSEQYQIWIGGQLWQDWHVEGVHTYEYTFTNRGFREIIIICNDTFVYYHEYHHSLTIFEDVFVTLSVPLEAPVNVSVNLDGTVIGEVSGPIPMLDVTLEVNGTDVQVDSTNGAGNYYFSLILDEPGYYSLLTKTLEADFYCAALSVESVLLIKSNPAEVQILSPLNQTYGTIVEFSFGGDAVDYWYRIDPLDETNISWSSSIFRELPEGNFRCHLYGQNAYGVVSYTSTNFTVDNTAPSLILLSPSNTTYTINDIQLSYLTDEENVVVSLDGLQLDDIRSGILTDLAEGSHNLTITSTDDVGNNISRVAFFDIDTIAPSLEIYSPYNGSYVSGVEIVIASNGSTILYYISSVHSYNQTYLEPLQLNLSVGHYSLVVYAFDDAGNVRTDSVSFSIVHTIELLVNPGCEVLDEAGNYVVHTQVMSHPNFDTVGINLNGSYIGVLEWSYLSQDYRMTIHLDSPGIWQVTLFANTTLEEYDFYYFEIVWDPPAPIFKSISLTHDSSYYEIRVQMDTGDLSLESIQVLYNDSYYDLTKYYGNRWECRLPFIAQNMTISVYTWYQWDEKPSALEKYAIQWYAPEITVEYTSTRTNFTLQVQVVKQNATIDTSSVTLVVQNGTTLITVNETSFYEDLTGSYQEWVFISPDLPPGIWNYSFSVADVFGITRDFTGLYNATDTPPVFGNFSVVTMNSNSEGEIKHVEIVVSDDYQVDSVTLLVDGIERTPITQNETHFIFEIWLDEGVHNLQVIAVDDIGQENTLFLPSIEVITYHSTSLTSDSEVSISYLSSQTDNIPDTDQKINGFGEILLAGTIFSGLVATGNVVNRKRRG